MKRLIYLAAPYWHPKKEVREWRAREAAKAAARILGEENQHVFAPTVHGFGVVQQARDLDGECDMWLELSINILRRCDELRVLQLPGWDKSRGVRLEMEIATAIGLPVRFMHPTH